MFHFCPRSSSNSSDELLTQNKRERYGLAKHNEVFDNMDNDNNNPTNKREDVEVSKSEVEVSKLEV